MSSLAVVGVTALAVVGAASPGASAPAEPTGSAAGLSIRADTDRDGRVDLTGDSDEAGKTVATPTRGALFLPNLDDDAARCAASNQTCNDAADAVVNGESDAQDLAPVLTTPLPSARADATATVAVEGTGANYTRLFVRKGSTWTPLTTSATFNSGDLRQGLTLGLEGRDIVRDRAVWDGTATVTVTLTDGATRAADSVKLSVAPLLTHAHTQTNQQLVAAPDASADYQKFRRDLAAAGTGAAMPKPLHTFDRAGDVWAQDWFEPAYASVARDGGAQRLRLLLRSDQARPAQLKLFGLRGRDVGVVSMTVARPPAASPRAMRSATFSSFGNLETIPPYSHGGKAFPAGRIIMGENPGSEGPSANTRKLLAAQQTQSPLMLDSGWLAVGHVDEFVQFVPANTPRGWRVAVADPLGAVAVIRKAVDAGKGGVSISSHAQARRMTLSAFLADRGLQDDQQNAARKIEANLATLKAETGVTDAEIVRVPGLYTSAARLSVTDATANRQLAALGPRPGLTDKDRRAALRQGMGALLPAAINSIVVSPTRVVAAKQWGPLVDGRDLMAEATTAAYQSAGMSVAFVDDYTTYHMRDGEVHCASNSLREIPAAWWRG
ncbi:protein-arginine deiminase family protein [Pilimelia columellifera]|uniref:protein-arginine deiminase family protein n=1 Tax=Pilimelia columellifera TaxID=706574 RepID=UPI0031D226D7